MLFKNIMPFLGHAAVAAFALFCATTVSFTARADWINLTGAETAANIAEITILDDRVRVALELLRPLGQQHRHPLIALDDRDQDGGRRDRVEEPGIGCRLMIVPQRARHPGRWVALR